MEFEEYFSFEAIVGDLVRWRVKGKGTVDENGRRDVERVLPPRRAWSRVGAKAREGIDPEAVRKQAIWRTVRRKCGGQGEKRSAMRWAQNLVQLVHEVQGAVFSGKVAFEKPRMMKIPKGYKDGVREFREVASFDRLADRVILSRTTAYVRDVLEGVLGNSCYSFRRDPKRSHQLAIEKLQEWRGLHAEESMYVAECDIRGFFDHIGHHVLRRCWDQTGFDPLAKNVLEAYLAVYSSEKGSAYVHSWRVRLQMGWSEPAEYTNCGRRGLPQGGSFSTVLANLVLHEADSIILRHGWGGSFYARYCDDVVIADTDETGCREILELYMLAMDLLELPVHPVKSFVYFQEDGRATDYYAIKSKGPFRWGEPKIGEADCAPWVSFLGSQVHYNGETRIRRESIEKHIRSLGRETAKAVQEIKRLSQDGARALPDALKWFARFRNRLIAKGVGYVTAKAKDCHLCWAGAFLHLTDCTDTRMQMRRLDRVREGLLCKVWRMLSVLPSGKEVHRRGRRYKGKPFSYFGFLREVRRPTNMRPRRRQFVLPYSEL